MKKIFTIFLCVIALAGFAFADDYFTANDLEPCAVKEPSEIDEIFSIYASSEKGVTIEALTGDVAERIAEDGEVFNTRIKLNGSGKVAYRSIHFVTDDAAVITVYCNSSSKTDDRVLAIVDVETGETIDEITAPADGEIAGIGITAVPYAGEFAIFSKGSGINIYQILIEY